MDAAGTLAVDMANHGAPWLTGATTQLVLFPTAE